MADISVTAASVVPGANATLIQSTAGETITAGMAVYLKASDSRWWKAQADGTIYVVSATAGGICPEADLASTNYVSILGVGSTAAVIKMLANGATGIAHA
jgi:hypothetical protein